MEFKYLFNVFDWLLTRGISQDVALIMNICFSFLIILVLAVIADFITDRIILQIIKKYVDRSKNKWDDILYSKRVFNRLSHLAPALVLYYTLGFTLSAYPKLVHHMHAGINIFMIIIILLVIDSFLSALNEIYKSLPTAKNRPIKGYIQVVKIVVYFIGILYIYSTLFDKEIGKLVTGLGALAAVLLLVFKDSLMGLVAGIQLSANDMVRIGDWIEMPKYGANGIVTEISLHTVKVQNGDKTISTIPSYALVSESFFNWRGMEESGSRRIKRSINIDMRSAEFLNEKQIEKFRKIQLLTSYIDAKVEELKQYNEQKQADDSVLVNGRRMTNLGTFRKYIELYLHNLNGIRKDMNILVRQLQPTENGIPIEIIAYANNPEWLSYEDLQANIFDHIITIVPEFGLRIFQRPTGDDFKG